MMGEVAPTDPAIHKDVPMRPPYAGVSRLAISLALFTVFTACYEDDAFGPDGDPPLPTRQVISCVADLAANQLSCEAPRLAASEKLSFLIVGGQRNYVTLASRNVSYNSGNGIFQADVRVQSRIVQPLGTPDGTTVTGIRPFFHTLPMTSDAGTVTVSNPAGTGTFTGSNQPYFEYSEILTRYGESAEQTWEWQIVPPVSTFTFEMLVDADIPAEGGVLRWRGRTDHFPTAMWGSGGELFAVGQDGIVRHDGVDWSVQRSPSTGDAYMAVSGTSVTDVFAVGLSGVIAHHDGVTWTSQASGTAQNLLGVWANAPDDVFAVGTTGTIRHYNGTSWSAQTSNTTQPLAAVWGASGSDVFAVGAAGTILHYDGANWSPQTSGTTEALAAVWGTSGSSVFAVGTAGTILYYNGTNWSSQTSGTAYGLLSVWGSSSSNVFAGGVAGAV